MTRPEGHAISPDWQPHTDEIDYGINLGFTEVEVKEMAEDMRLWALANRNRQIARKADWHLTFLTWLRNHAKWDGKRRPVKQHEKSYAELAEELRNGTGPDVTDAPSTNLDTTSTPTSAAVARYRRCY